MSIKSFDDRCNPVKKPSQVICYVQIFRSSFVVPKERYQTITSIEFCVIECRKLEMDVDSSY